MLVDTEVIDQEVLDDVLGADERQKALKQQAECRRIKAKRAATTKDIGSLLVKLRLQRFQQRTRVHLLPGHLHDETLDLRLLLPHLVHQCPRPLVQSRLQRLQANHNHKCD